MIIGPREYLGVAPGPARLAELGPRRLRADRPAVDPRDAPAGPRLVARARRDPRRDAVHVGREPALADRDGQRCPRRAPARVDVRAARLPEGPDPLLLQPERRHPGLGLAGRPVADHGRVGRAARHRADERDADPRQFLPVQESDFVFAVLAQELGFIGALVRVPAVRGAAVADPRRAPGGRRTPSGRCSAPASRRCSCSSCRERRAW